MATPPIAALNADIFRRFPGTRSMGIDNCRPVTGNPNVWSQHAWGNALDIGVPDRATGDRVAAYLRGGMGRLNLSEVIWWVKDHYDHVHVSGAPKMSGTPPCAGGRALTPMGTDKDTSGGFDLVGAAAGGSMFGVVGALIGGLTAANSPVDVAKTGLALLFSGETWLRVMWAVGGAVALGAGVVWLARDLGAPIPTVKDIAGKVVSTAKTVATKGLA